ncbi:Major Facilitator Superfamily protein [Streptomyces sp. 2323.1]|uniref:MFS transporter n=1 Tax=Streptomyces sp. 2323.1 TaxID=1938841 RepID=UPI000BC071E3|nr:MFS transporter [Streptomyces sp. 2323.1]SOE11007.1 Major Facilitator Superfamily protein [Streptomyces sp. 2323.1]
MSGRTWVVDGYVLAFAALLLLADTRRSATAPAGFVLRARAARTPILPVALFADSSFTAANTVGFLFNFAFYGVLFVLRLFPQTGRGASPVTAGLQMLPAVLARPFSNLLYTRIGPRLGNRAAHSGSLAFSAAGYALLFMILTPGLPYGVLATVLAVAHIGSGVSSPALTGALMDAAGREHADIGSATLNANRQIGSLVGIAVMGAVFTGVGSGHRGATCAFALTAGARAVAAVAGRLGIRSRA